MSPTPETWSVLSGCNQYAIIPNTWQKARGEDHLCIKRNFPEELSFFYTTSSKRRRILSAHKYLQLKLNLTLDLLLLKPMNIYIKDKYQKLSWFGHAKTKGILLYTISCYNCWAPHPRESSLWSIHLLLALPCGSQGAKKTQKPCSSQKGHPIQIHRSSV